LVSVLKNRLVYVTSVITCPTNSRVRCSQAWLDYSMFITHRFNTGRPSTLSASVE